MPKAVEVFNFVHPDAVERSNASALDADYFGPSLTIQSEAASCDINRILDGYNKTGLINHLNEYQGRYGDFVDAPTYHAAMNALIKAQDMFDSLPGNVRAHFENDPEKFLAFAQDPSNAQAMVDLGLATVSDSSVESAADAAPASKSPPGKRPKAGEPDGGGVEAGLTPTVKEFLQRLNTTLQEKPL